MASFVPLAPPSGSSSAVAVVVAHQLFVGSLSFVAVVVALAAVAAVVVVAAALAVLAWVSFYTLPTITDFCYFLFFDNDDCYRRFLRARAF